MDEAEAISEAKATAQAIVTALVHNERPLACDILEAHPSVLVALCLADLACLLLDQWTCTAADCVGFDADHDDAVRQWQALLAQLAD